MAIRTAPIIAEAIEATRQIFARNDSDALMGSLWDVLDKPTKQAVNRMFCRLYRATGENVYGSTFGDGDLARRRYVGFLKDCVLGVLVEFRTPVGFRFAPVDTRPVFKLTAPPRPLRQPCLF